MIGTVYPGKFGENRDHNLRDFMLDSGEGAGFRTRQNILTGYISAENLLAKGSGDNAFTRNRLFSFHDRLWTALE